ncbi:MAG: regulatory protein RecX [Brevinema sp.]
MKKNDKIYSIDELRNKILYFINYKPRSLNEVKKKMLLLNAQESQIQQLLTELINVQLINDQKIIRLYIEQFLESKKFGVYRTKLELIRKGFAKELVESEVSCYIDQEEYHEESQALETLCLKYRHTIPEKEQMIGFLIRKGFSYQSAKEAVSIFIIKHT